VATSIVDNEKIPDQYSAKWIVRASLAIGGWRIRPEGTGVLLSYLVKVSLNGSIPATIVSSLANDLPMCVGKVRDIYNSRGYAPYVVPSESTSSIKFQTEQWSDQNYISTFSAPADPVQFSIRYDHAKMYPRGIQTEVEGDAREGVKVDMGEDGIIKVNCEGGHVGTFSLVVTRDK